MKLVEEGYGTYVDKDRMARDKVLPTRNCFCAFVKRDIRGLNDDFFKTVRDRDCNANMYIENYDKPIDDSMKKVAIKYSLDRDILLITPLQTDTESKYISYPNIQCQYSASV